MAARATASGVHAAGDIAGEHDDPDAEGRMSGATEPLLEAVAMVRVPVLLSAARLLDCSPRTVRRRIAERVLPAVVEHGRVMVRGDELRAYIDGLERVG